MIEGLNSPGIRQIFLQFDAIDNLTAELETMIPRPSESDSSRLEESKAQNDTHTSRGSGSL